MCKLFSVRGKVSEKMDWFFQIEDFSAWIKSFGIWAVIVSLLLNIIISILGFIPSIFLSGANAVVFGLIPGFIISVAGEVLGAAVSFLLYRWGFRRIRGVRNESWKWLNQVNQASRGRRMLLLFTARLTPFLPSAVITFAASVSQITFVDFIVVTLLGKAPSIALETLVGNDLFFMKQNFPRLIITLLLLAIIVLLMRSRKK